MLRRLGFNVSAQQLLMIERVNIIMISTFLNRCTFTTIAHLLGNPSFPSAFTGFDRNSWHLKKNFRPLQFVSTLFLPLPSACHTALAPVLPTFASKFGIGAAAVGMTISVFAIARLLLNMPAGVAADRYGAQFSFLFIYSSSFPISFFLYSH